MFPCEIYQFYESATVADPDLQIRGGGGGGGVGGSHPDSEIRRGGSQKFFFFGSSWPHFGLIIRGDPAP